MGDPSAKASVESKPSRRPRHPWREALVWRASRLEGTVLTVEYDVNRHDSHLEYDAIQVVATLGPDRAGVTLGTSSNSQLGGWPPPPRLSTSLS